MNLFLTGDARAVLATLPAASVHCIVTSPLYYGLRDYGVDPSTWADGWTGCLGLEETPEAFVAHMVEVFREVARVLRPDGTLWLTLGDSYASGGRSGGGSQGARWEEAGDTRTGPRGGRWRKEPPGFKDKDLLGIPWMVAFALRAAGWYLRSDIIWAKPNPLPESVRDRPTRSHEFLFLFAHPASKASYFYDNTAIAEEATGRSSGNKGGRKLEGADRDRLNDHRGHSWSHEGAATRNARDVWTITPRPFKGAHFAVMPPDLAERCIRAGTSEHGVCSACGAPWARVLGRLCDCGAFVQRQAKACPDCGVVRDWKAGRTQSVDLVATDWSTPGKGTPRLPGGFSDSLTESSWRPTCAHADAPRVPAITLDPFGGAGTVAYVSQSLGRSSVYIDAKPAYRDIAVERVHGQADP